MIDKTKKNVATPKELKTNNFKTVGLIFRRLLEHVRELSMTDQTDDDKKRRLEFMLKGLADAWNLAEIEKELGDREIKLNKLSSLVATIETCEARKESNKMQMQASKEKKIRIQKEDNRCKKISSSRKEKYHKQFDDFKEFHLGQLKDDEYNTFSIQQKINRFYRCYSEYKKVNVESNSSSVQKRISRWIDDIKTQSKIVSSK